MHELFLTAHVLEDDFETALRILQGYCAMSPTHVLTRKLTFEGPRTRTPKPIDPNFLKSQLSPKTVLWKSLSDQLARQSYIINVLYEVPKESFGRGENDRPEDSESPPREGLLLDQRPGTLRWNDLPDPTAAKPVNSRLPDPGLTRPVNSRLMVSIENQNGLCSILKQAMNHRFVREVIQESNRFVNGNVAFELTRYLQIPINENEKGATIRNQLPAFNTLTPFDSENKWILTTSVLVAKGDDPVQMKTGMDDLVAVKTDFEGCFDFKALDRHIFDTRIKF